MAILEEEAVATLEGFTAGLAAVESGLWRTDSTDRSRRGDVVMARGIIRTLVLRVFRSI